ncbi:MAG TPA: AAA family ATPase [Candidatus Thermoplasmatota archaeon]|nr:AAA family ATPase [Candidatus Thermoplasmatota archaeon]
MTLIAVAGLPGTGTTTLCRNLSPRLRMPHVYAGQIFRAMAKEHGMDVNAFGSYAETHPEIDIELDRRMIEVAKQGGIILEGRMVAWQLREAHADGLKVLLEAPEEVRARRVADREGAKDWMQVLAQNRHREASEAKRYREFYGFDPNDPRHYDLVIDSSTRTPDEIAELVLSKLGPSQA